MIEGALRRPVDGVTTEPDDGARRQADAGRSLDVLLVSQPTTYGVAVYVRQLVEAAVAAGHRVTVACPSATTGPLAGWVVAAGAEHRRVDLARRPGPRDLVDLWSLRRLARGRDVLHLHSSKAAALGRLAAASLGRSRPAVVVTPHYWSWFVGGPWSWLYRAIEWLLARCCDTIVAVSVREAERGRRVLGRAAGRIVVIRSGVDLERFSPDGDRARRGSDAPLLVCIGRLSVQKGQDVAIRALALLGDRTARLRLVGDESEHGTRRRLGALAARLGVADRVEWRGSTPDIAPELRAADVVVAPSRWEGMSLAYLEALACGAPVVVTDVAGSEVVEGAGVVVPRDDPQTLAAAIDRLLADPVERGRLAAAARERSLGFDHASMVRANLDLWANLAATARGRVR